MPNAKISALTPAAFLDGTEAAPFAKSGSNGAATSSVASTYDSTILSTQFPRARSAIARVRSGKSSGAFALLGDSTSFGTGATVRNKNLVSAMMGVLNGFGVPADTDSIWGMPAGFSYAQLATYDSRFSQSGTGGLGAGGGIKSLGGNMFNLTASGDWFGFAPEQTVNRFEIWFPTGGQFGTFNVTIDGSSTALLIDQNKYGGTWTWDGSAFTQTSAPVATDGRFSVATINISSAGMHTVRATWASTNVRISGIRGYRSDISRLSLYNWGRPGETAVNWAAGNTSGSWNILASTNNGPLEYMPIDMVVVDLGINDANTGVTDAAFQTAMQSLVTGVKTRGAHDCALNVPVPSNFSAISEAAQRGKWDVIRALSLSAPAPILTDIPIRWGNYAGAQPLGYYSDNTHPENSGYADKAASMIGSILR